MSITTRSIPELLRVRATEQPDAAAYTFIDYELDANGFAETLTWSQVHQRAVNVAEELRLCGSPGDRAAILAPQGLEYVVAFLGALEAGFLAVPLPVPLLGARDERVAAALRDCAASVVLTTSTTVDAIAEYTRTDGPHRAPTVMEVDSIDLDFPRAVEATARAAQSVAYLQYTSGSTGRPSGAMMTHRNFVTNFDQMVAVFFEDRGKTPPADTTIVSWLPFYHDMGLMLGIGFPLAIQRSAVLTSPVSFLQRPARWLHALADNPGAFSAAPNFAFHLAARRIPDEDMAGHDLGRVLAIYNGSERVNAKTISRFSEKFARFNLSSNAVRPSYGLAEATVYVAVSKAGQPSHSVSFVADQLSAGKATRCESDTEGCTELVSYHLSGSPLVRIVDTDTCTENPEGGVGEIWVHGDNVGPGYWGDRMRTEHTFGARLAAPTPGTPEGPWLRTGDIGVISDGELFIIGRIKDLLVVNGRNHYPDDIEATIQEITKGRVAAISVPDEATEQVVAVVEVKEVGNSGAEKTENVRSMKRELTSAISQAHGLRIFDLVLVPPGSIPVTTSGKIRRSSCVEHYQHGTFERLDV
jgi:acyl-CoA synthetase (AMP-forming)/AMP-acid ligase II